MKTSDLETALAEVARLEEERDQARATTEHLRSEWSALEGSSAIIARSRWLRWLVAIGGLAGGAGAQLVLHEPPPPSPPPTAISLPLEMQGEPPKADGLSFTLWGARSFPDLAGVSPSGAILGKRGVVHVPPYRTQLEENPLDQFRELKAPVQVDLLAGVETAVDRLGLSVRNEWLFVGRDGVAVTWRDASADRPESWSIEKTGVDVDLLAIARAPSTETSSGIVFAVGQNGTILRRENKIWMSEITEGVDTLRAVAASDHAAVAVGDNGVILQRDRLTQRWTRIVAATSSTLRAIVREADDRFYVAGDHGTLLSLDAGSGRIRLLPTETTDDFVGMGSALLDLVLATRRGEIMIRTARLMGIEFMTHPVSFETGQVAGVASQRGSVLLATTTGQAYFGKLTSKKRSP